VVTQSQFPTLSRKTVVEKTIKFNSFISIHNIHCAYSYSYSDAYLSLVDNVLGRELVIYLYNNDVFGCERLTAIPSVATTTPFTEEGTIDDACSMKTISISASLARKSDEEIRSGCCRRR